MDQFTRRQCYKVNRATTLRRAGSTITELLVAATLLMTAMTIAGQLTIQSRRMWIEIRHHQLATDELNNQLERLITMDVNEMRGELTSLNPSETAAEVLSNVRLEGKWIDDDDGKRVALSINWDRAVSATPLTMVAWIAPQTGIQRE